LLLSGFTRSKDFFTLLWGGDTTFGGSLLSEVYGGYEKLVASLKNLIIIKTHTNIKTMIAND